MATITAERRRSRCSVDGDDPSGEMLYYVHGAANGDDAKTAVRAVLPATFTARDASGTAKSLVPTTMECDVQHDESGNELYYVTAHFGLFDFAESSFEFDTTGGTQRVTQSLATVGAYGTGATTADYKGAIAVTNGGKTVEGTDIIIPRFAFKERHVMPVATVTQAYMVQLADLTGTYNNATWRGFAAGEVLFEGARGVKTGADDWEIEFMFNRSPNLSSYSVGDITVTSKLGWHLQWVIYKAVENNTIHEITPQPKAVYIERVYDPGDFSLLGISYSF